MFHERYLKIFQKNFQEPPSEKFIRKPKDGWGKGKLWGGGEGWQAQESRMEPADVSKRSLKKGLLIFNDLHLNFTM